MTETHAGGGAGALDATVEVTENEPEQAAPEDEDG